MIVTSHVVMSRSHEVNDSDNTIYSVSQNLKCLTLMHSHKQSDMPNRHATYTIF